MSRIGVVAALPMEARCLTDHRFPRNQVVELPGGGMLAVSGPGPARAQCMAERLVEEGATELISWGLAGGLAPGIAPGTLIVADSVIPADGPVYKTDWNWRQGILPALRARVPVVVAPLLVSDRLVSSPGSKAALLHRFSAVAVDMESGAIASVSSRYQLSWLALRVVVDPAEMALPPEIIEAVDSRGELRLPRLGYDLVRQPRLLGPLCQLAWHARTALASLRRIADVVTGGGDSWASRASIGSLSAPP